VLQHDNSSNEGRTAPPLRHPDNMKQISKPKPGAARSRPNPKFNAGPRSQRTPHARKHQSFGSSSSPRNAQNAERNYQRYLVLARAETLAGDQVAAENYFQHAEHYLRLMAMDAT
jgi:hypothetical protein